jgi:hypothetical protein
MPKNALVLIIRHAEKPDDHNDSGLSLKGQCRAAAYAVYFQNYTVASTLIRFDYLVAAADSDESCRPHLTIEPLRQALGGEINARHRDDEYSVLAQAILEHPKYDNCHTLICWHHEKILELAAELGVVAGELPAESAWPQDWPEDVYGWILQLVYDSEGHLVPEQTRRINQELMYSDHGGNPPL